MKYKPIEIRTLRHPDLSTLQGSVYLWLEVFEKKDKIPRDLPGEDSHLKNIWYFYIIINKQ